MRLIGLPSTLPPKSSIAICAAVTEPWPVGVDAGPFMSVSTPILTTLSDICANTAVDASIAAASTPNMDRFRTNIPRFSLCIGHIGRLCRQAVVSANWSHLQLIRTGVNLAGRKGLAAGGIGFCLFSPRFRASRGHDPEPALAELAVAARGGARRPVERRQAGNSWGTAAGGSAAVHRRRDAAPRRAAAARYCCRGPFCIVRPRSGRRVVLFTAAAGGIAGLGRG